MVLLPLMVNANSKALGVRGAQTGGSLGSFLVTKLDMWLVEIPV